MTVLVTDGDALAGLLETGEDLRLQRDGHGAVLPPSPLPFCPLCRGGAAMNKRRPGGMGASSILMIFVVLALTTFGILSFLSARADLRLTERAADHTVAYYKADRAVEGYARRQSTTPWSRPGGSSPPFPKPKRCPPIRSPAGRRCMRNSTGNSSPRSSRCPSPTGSLNFPSRSGTGGGRSSHSSKSCRLKTPCAPRFCAAFSAARRNRASEAPLPVWPGND